MKSGTYGGQLSFGPLQCSGHPLRRRRQVAESYGAHGIRVTKEDDIIPALEAAKNNTDALDEAHQKKKKTAVPNTAQKSQPKNRFNNFEQRSYDYDQLEKMLLTTSAQH